MRPVENSTCKKLNSQFLIIHKEINHRKFPLSPFLERFQSMIFRKEKNYFNHLLQVENMTTPVWFAPTYTLPERYKNIPVTCPDRMCKDELKNYGYLRLHLLECHNGLPHNWNLTSDEYLRDSVKVKSYKNYSFWATL